MGFESNDSGIAASIYLGLYFFYTLVTTYIFFKRGWRHIYTFLLTFALIRLGSQLCGVAFAVLGFSHWQWLIAYLILGAEGYFALIYASFRFICNAQKKEVGYSWVMKTGPKFSQRMPKVINWLFGSWIDIFHHILVPANILVIVGGSLLAGIGPDEYAQYHNKIKTAKILRTIGQAIFLTLTLVMICLNFYVYYFERIRNHVTHSVFLASPFLMVRGIFGILSIYISNMNYFQLSNYSDGFSSKLVVYEYVSSTTMEFVSAVFLLSNYFFNSKNDSDLRLLVDEKMY